MKCSHPPFVPWIGPWVVRFSGVLSSKSRLGSHKVVGDDLKPSNSGSVGFRSGSSGVNVFKVCNRRFFGAPGKEAMFTVKGPQKGCKPEKIDSKRN